MWVRNAAPSHYYRLRIEKHLAINPLCQATFGKVGLFTRLNSNFETRFLAIGKENLSQVVSCEVYFTLALKGLIMRV